MKLDRRAMLLYAITDRAWLNGRTLYEQVEDALKGGITCLQLREKNLYYDSFLAEAIEIRQLCKKYNVPFIINDNIDIALKCGADGVHIGQRDTDAKQARALIGRDKILGVTAKTVSQARKAAEDGADYLGTGAVFATSTKPDAIGISRDTLKSICQSVDLPIVAIGGINSENILQLTGSGVDGVALVSAIFSAENITEECHRLRLLSEKMVGQQGK